jgi:hypothetical protein
MLQVKESSNQSGAQCRATGAGDKVGTKGAFDLSPVDGVGQFHQGMLRIDHFQQGLLKQGTALRHSWLRTHKSPAEFARFRYEIISFLAVYDTGFNRQHRSA